MTKNEKYIFSENPEDDLWEELLKFAYEENIKRYFKKKGFEEDNNVINTISGSFFQAYEYYKSSKSASLQISPLLLYYGTVNLFNGMADLMAGKVVEIKTHGMKIEIDEHNQFIAGTKVKFNNPEKGGVHLFADAFGYDIKLTEYGNDWILDNFLDSIAEINDDYLTCYNKSFGNVCMLDVYKTPDGLIEKAYFNENQKQELLDLFGHVLGFEKSYLRPTIGKKNGQNYYILRHKMAGEDISQISYSGQPYLRASHIKNSRNITVPTPISMHIILFVLASLCRYYPEIWSPFVQKDTTGEKLLFEKLLFYIRRMVPNFVLNHIYNKKVKFSSDKYTIHDMVKLVGEHEVKEIVAKEVMKRMNNINL